MLFFMNNTSPFTFILTILPLFQFFLPIVNNNLIFSDPFQPIIHQNTSHTFTTTKYSSPSLTSDASPSPSYTDSPLLDIPITSSSWPSTFNIPTFVPLRQSSGLTLPLFIYKITFEMFLLHHPLTGVILSVITLFLLLTEYFSLTLLV